MTAISNFSPRLSSFHVAELSYVPPTPKARATVQSTEECSLTAVATCHSLARPP
jgi:hypothetical protein